MVLIGGNDIRAARSIRAAGINADTAAARREAREAADASLQKAVDSERAQVMKLISAGARDILVVNAPDIGAIPETDLMAAQVLAAASNKKEQRQASRLPDITSKLSARYNQKLARRIGQLERQTGVPIINFDLYSFVTEQIDMAEDYGYTNTSDACIFVFSQGGAVNPACTDFPTASGFIFWDEIHPTTRVHQSAGIDIVETLLGD